MMERKVVKRGVEGEAEGRKKTQKAKDRENATRTEGGQYITRPQIGR